MRVDETFVTGSTGSRAEPGSGAPLCTFPRPTRPSPPSPPNVHLSLWFHFQGEVVDPALFMSAVKQAKGGSRNADTVCCFGFVGPEEVFLESPHHNRTTNPDPQDGHGQDGPRGKKTTPARTPTETSARVWVGRTRPRTAGRRGGLNVSRRLSSLPAIHVNESFKNRGRLPPPSIGRF